jgi:acetylornithine deacetylase/succinyl-diaminopimelate desuccinylase-like protein
MLGTDPAQELNNGGQQMDPKINGDRLWGSLMTLAEVGATSGGGVCRLALSDEDRVARDLFVRWCRDAGCSIRIDAVGNIFARRPGRNSARAPVMTGSHLDSQPNGGRFDGTYGVMAGLEVLRALDEAHITTDAPLEVVVWTNEEGTRFAPSMMGSMAFAGLLELQLVYQATDAQGRTFRAELERTGYRGEGLGGSPIGAYFEAQIAPFDARCVAAVREAAACEGHSHMDMVSGAAHDAIAIARIAPTAMIFVPCAGGISHNETESATPDDLAAGCQVLMRSMLAASSWIGLR